MNEYHFVFVKKKIKLIMSLKDHAIIFKKIKILFLNIKIFTFDFLIISPKICNQKKKSSLRNKLAQP